MGQSFTFALDHVEREFVRVQTSETHDNPPSFEASTTTPGDSSRMNNRPTDAIQDEDDPYARQNQVSTNIKFSVLRRITLPESIRVHTSHIAVLYCLDSNHDGLFSCDDLTNFVKWVFLVVPADISAEEFAETVQAKATLRMWKECREVGERRINAGETTLSGAVNNTATMHGMSEADLDSTLHLCAAEHFVQWMLLFLERNFSSPPAATRSANPTASLMASLSPQPEASIQINHLPGAIADDLSSITSPTARDDDDTPFFSPTAPPPLPPLPPQPSAATEPETFGLEAIQCVYLLLNVKDGYGMTFPQFCRVLQPSASMANSCELDSRQLFSVKKSSLAPLLMSFIRAYWRILSRLGLAVLLQ